MNPIIIYYSKTAYRFGLFAAIIIFLVGIAMITVIQNRSWNFSINLFSKLGVFGILLMLISVLLGNVYRKKLMDIAPVIIIDNEGITLNSTEHKITWDEIDHIEILETNVSKGYKDKFIVPVLKNPEAHFNNVTKNIMRTLNKFDINANAGLPIHISTNFLTCSFDELKNILETRLKEYNTRKFSDSN